MPAIERVNVADLEAWADAKAQNVAALSFEKPLKSCLVALKADVKENFAGSHAPDGTPWTPLKFPRVRSKGQDHPLRDRGLLMASISAGEGHVESVDSHSFEVGTNLVYAAIHQHGGVIRPTSGKFLAIPLTKEAYAVGSPRNWTGARLSCIVGQRGGVLVERKQQQVRAVKAGGSGFAARKSAAVSQQRQRLAPVSIIAHYALVRSVTIPARPFLGFSERVLGTFEDIIGDFLERQAV